MGCGGVVAGRAEVVDWRVRVRRRRRVGAGGRYMID